jgi:hypothetical protein
VIRLLLTAKRLHPAYQPVAQASAHPKSSLPMYPSALSGPVLTGKTLPVALGRRQEII